MCSLIDIVTTFYDACLVMLEPSKRWNIQSACTYLYTSGQSLFFFHVVSHDPHCLVDDMSLSIDNKSKLRMISLSLSLSLCVVANKTQINFHQDLPTCLTVKFTLQQEVTHHWTALSRLDDDEIRNFFPVTSHVIGLLMSCFNGLL